MPTAAPPSRPLVEAPALDLVWDRIETAVLRSAQPAPIRAARALGLTEPASVLLTASASLRTAWLSSSAVALGFAMIASCFTHGGVLWPFLIVAPLIPAIGVAVSYDHAAESLETLIATTPYGRQRLILARTLAVLLTSLPVAFVLSLLLPGPVWVAAAWLGPALAMIPVLMAIASFVGPRPAAAIVAVAVVRARPRRHPTAPGHLAHRGPAAGRVRAPRRGRLRRPSRPRPFLAPDGRRAVNAAVELRGVSKKYGATVALADVDLTLGRGVTGLLGPNGAGKTTLLRIVATSIAPDSGEVRLLGRDPLAQQSELTEVRRSLGYLPQELGLPGDMTVFGFVDYIAVLKEWNDQAERTQEVRRVVELVGLSESATKRVSKLSGGQRRRVALAQSMLGDPRILILDEPTTGLDPTQRATLRRTLSTIATRCAVLLSTHQTEDVAALCERVVVLAGGTIRFDGPVLDLVAQAAGQVWLVDDETASIDSGVASWRTGTGRYRVVGGPPPPGSEAAEPTLEDAYLLMLGDQAAAALP